MDSQNRIRFRILVVDNESSILEIFADSLESAVKTVETPPKPEYEVVTCLSSTKAVELVGDSLRNNNPFAIVFLDIHMPTDKNGIWAARKIRSLDQEIEIVMITGYSDLDAEDAISTISPAHKILFVRKPLYPQEIYHFSVSLADKWKTEKELKAIKTDLEQKVALRGRELKILSQERQSDAEERKEIEEGLKRLRLAMDLSGESVFIIDPQNGQLLEVNKRASIELGYGDEELKHLTLLDIDENLPSLAVFLERMNNIRRQPGINLVENGRHKRKDGTTYPVELTSSLKKIGKKDYLLTTAKDVSQWQDMMDELSASKAHLAMAQEISDLGSWELGKKGQVLYWSDESHRIFGSELQKGLPKVEEILERIDPNDVDRLVETIKTTFATKSSFDMTHRLVLPNDKIKYIRQRGKVICDDSGNVFKIVGTAQDITRRKLDENEMQRLRNLLANIINSMPSILIGVDVDGRVNQWNQEAQRFTGIPTLNALNQPLKSVLSELPLAADMVQQAVAKRETLKETKIQVVKENKTSLFDIMVYPLISDKVEGTVVLVENVTDRVRMEEIMMQTEKMFTVGGLAAGMAHEINNPLAGIIQNLQVIQNRISSKLPKNAVIAIQSGTTIEQIEEYFKKRKLNKTIEKVLEAGHRAAKIVENMLNFSYKAGTLYTMYDLAELLDKTVELAYSEYDLKNRFDFRQIEIIRDYSNEAPKVPCEGNTIQQVFFNILKNGAHAMASNIENNTKPCFHLRVIPEKDFVCVEIEDNGPGMDEKTRTRIFEPFFTTKEVGVGTGLGMAVSYFIITENHGGTISVESEPGKGALFIIRLPV